MKVEELQEWCKDVFGIAFPILISVSITKALYLADNIWIDIAIIGSILAFVSSGVCYVFANRVCYEYWKVKHKNRLKKSIIGIFEEEKLTPNKSRFSPKYWSELVCDNYETEYFSGLDLDKNWYKYVAIINPYGECYPEVDIGEKKTFKKIKEYVKNGGIFVSTCGCAFWYAWNEEVNQIPTAGEVYYREIVLKKEVIVDKWGNPQETGRFLGVTTYPAYKLNPVQSLTDTLTFHELKLLTTSGFPRIVKIYQNDKEKNRFGDMSDIAKDGYIVEFRSTRKPSQNYKPIMRAKLPNPDVPDKMIDVFPLSYVPHGDRDGKFLFTGMHMDLEMDSLIHYVEGWTDELYPILWSEYNKDFTNEIIDEQPKLIYKALDVLIKENMAKFKIKIDGNYNRCNSIRNSLNCRM